MRRIVQLGIFGLLIALLSAGGSSPTASAAPTPARIPGVTVNTWANVVTLPHQTGTLQVIRKAPGTSMRKIGNKIQVHSTKTGSFQFLYRVTPSSTIKRILVTFRKPVAPPVPTPTPEQVEDSKWRFVGFDEFTAIDHRWERFSGTPGCCPDTLWDPSMVGIENGTLKVSNRKVNGQWLSGGLGGWNWDAAVLTSGRVDARMRWDATTGFSANGLMWPDNGMWPPELNFFEVFETWGASAGKSRVTAHSIVNGQHVQTMQDVYIDPKEWHTYSVRWTPTYIDYVIDGASVMRVTDPAKIHQDVPYWVGFQTQVHRMNGAYPNLPEGSEVNLFVDWVHVYSYDG